MALSSRPISTAPPMSSEAASGSTATSFTSSRLLALVDRLLYCADAGRLYVSNSLILLLAITGARLDPAHNYREESLAVNKGTRTYDPTFRVLHPQVQAFSQLYRHNLVVSRDGNISVQPKLTPAYRLESFGDYFAEMSRVLQSVHANYSDSARSVRLDRSPRFPPVTTPLPCLSS